MKSLVMQKMKDELKGMASEIRRLKNHRPLKFRENYDLWDLDQSIREASRQFRFDHVVYCLLRGRTMEQIEKPRVGNELSTQAIESSLKLYRKMLDEELYTIHFSS